MDEKFNKILEKLDEVTETSNGALENIKKQFEKVRKTQDEIETLLRKAQNELNDEIKNQQEKVDKLLTEFNKAFDSKKKEWDTSFSSSSKSLRELEGKYRIEVTELIASIKMKAAEILRIDELLNSIKNNLSNSIKETKSLVEKNDMTVKNIQRSFANLKDEKTISEILTQLKNYEKRIKKLEDDSHTHIFFGSKS